LRTGVLLGRCLGRLLEAGLGVALALLGVLGDLLDVARGRQLGGVQLVDRLERREDARRELGVFLPSAFSASILVRSSASFFWAFFTRLALDMKGLSASIIASRRFSLFLYSPSSFSTFFMALRACPFS
jgi:hypothetical protein